MTPPNQPEPIDLDAAVVGSLVKLTDGRIDPFADQQSPPDEVRTWIEHATLPQTHGVLSLSLRRWHALNRGRS